MVARAVRAVPGGDKTPVKPKLDVLLLYEDLGTALRATRSLDLLPGQLGVEAGWSTKLWRLDLLSVPLLAEQAAIEAAAAEVIILSLHGHTALRAEVCHWLRRWLDHKKDRPYALAALLDPEPCRPDIDKPVVAYLKRFTEAANADLFFGFHQVPVPD